MLNAIAPLALINRAISPVHFSIPFTFVIPVPAFINAAGAPLEHTLASLLVIEEVAPVLVAVGLLGLGPESVPVISSLL